MATMLFRLIQIFREVLDQDDLSFDATSEDPIDGWDSLAHIEVVLAIESAFDLTLTTEDAANMTSIPAILDALASKGIAD